MQTRLHSLALFLLLGLTAEQGFAQIITTTNSSAPTSNVVISSSYAGANNLAWRSNSASDYRVMYQSFTTPGTAFELDSISIGVSSESSGALDAGYTLTLYTFPTNTSTASSTTVASWTGTLPHTTMSAGTFLTFDVPNLTLNASTVYGFSLSFDSSATNRAVGLYAGPGIYNGGLLFYMDQTGAYSSTSNDMAFVIQSVPETSSLSFAFIGLGGLLLLRGLIRTSLCSKSAHVV